MDYRDLPYDAEIEYLHSPVGSYIVIPSNFNCEEFTRYVSHFQFQSNIRQQRLFNSSKRAIYENGSGLLAAAQNNDWVSSGLNWSTECIVDVDTHKRKTFFYDKSMALLRTTTHSSVGNAYYELLLFTSADQTQNANVKCWDFKAYIDDDLVLDLIPVRVGNVGYMYDRVSGKLFGNVGTGSFILGPDVAPGRYANEVAFLESWSNQYIDTGIKPSTDTKIELKCLYCKSGAGLTNYGALIGADDRDNAYILNHSAVANFTYGTEFSNNFANPQTRLLTFDSTASPQNMRVYDEGGSLVTTLTCIRGVFEVNQNLYLFAINRNGTPVYGSNRIMYCKIYDGNTLVRDYVPVEYNGVGYMYDKVSGLFFNNQGTGKFLFGSIAKACARSYTRRQLMAAQEYDYLQGGLLSANGLIPLDINPYGATWSFEGSIEKYGSGTFATGSKMISSNLNNTTYREYRFSFTATSTFSISTYTRFTSSYWTSWAVSGNKVVFSTNKTTEATVNGETKSLKAVSGNVYTSSPQLRLGDWGLQRCQMIFHYLKAWNNDVLVADYVVVRRKKDNVLGVLNRVNGNFIVPTRGTFTTI